MMVVAYRRTSNNIFSYRNFIIIVEKPMNGDPFLYKTNQP